MAFFAKQNSFPWVCWHWIPYVTSCRENPAVLLLPLKLLASDTFCHPVPWRPCCSSPSPVIVLERLYWMTVTDVFTCFVSMYRQQSIITKKECCTFYDELSSLVKDIPLRDHILIWDDLNAPFTADGCWVKNVCGKPNSNSEVLLAFINLHDLIAASSIMRQKRIKLPTLDSPRGRYLAGIV